MRTMEIIEARAGELTPQRFESRGPWWIAGLRGQFTCHSQEEIASLWRRFLSHSSGADHKTRNPSYGVCLDCMGSDTFDYLCGIEIPDSTSAPESWARVRMAAHTYAVFRHPGPVSDLRETVNAIFEQWLPHSGLEVAETAPDEPDFLECYSHEFDPDSGLGGIEIWIPIHSPSGGGAVTEISHDLS